MAKISNISDSSVSRPTWLGKVTRRSVSDKDLKEAAEQIELDPTHAKNGWTPESLAIYFKERREAQSNTILHRRPARPTRTNSKYNPHRWRTIR